MTRPDPQPVTVTDSLLAQVRDELRTLNGRLGGAEPSGPAVADGMTVTEQPAEQPGDTVMADRPPEPEPDTPELVGNASLSCPHCPRTFTTASGLSRHRRAKHEEA